MRENSKLLDRIKISVLRYFDVSNDGVVFDDIVGGFTGAAKYKVEVEGRGSYFLKVADEKTHELDAFLIEAEGKIYDFLDKVGLVGDVFPKFDGLISEDGFKILVIDYLDNVSWGGPWNTKTVELLDRTLKRLHTTDLSEGEKKEIIKLADSVRGRLGQKTSEYIESEVDKKKKREEFLKAWDVSGRGFLNAKGEIYFNGNKDLAEEVLDVASSATKVKQTQLIMHDMNFANIGFSKDRAYLVDPVFVGLGSEYFDRTVAGVNILLGLRSGGDLEVKKLVTERFLVNRVALAKLIKYYVDSSFKKLGMSQDAWQKFHQNCAEVALGVFIEMK